MNAAIKSIIPGSPAAESDIAVGDLLIKINGRVIVDVLDYKFLSYDEDLTLELLGADKMRKLVRISKAEGADLGLEFDTFLMDKERSCANKCIFCFIDQNPPGMRETIYYKDDDMRLSFLQGNYITLTNLSKTDVKRIIRLRISPINVSIHTMEPKLRELMLGNKNAGASIEILRELAHAGILMNLQIVCCPGVNDKAHLQATIKSIIALGERVNSVSVVPVGLTKHRQGLFDLKAVDRDEARSIIRLVMHYSGWCLRDRDSRVFYCADELYIKAGLKLPADELYENYPQLENGVGMMRLLITEFEDELERLTSREPKRNEELFQSDSARNHADDGRPARHSFSVATGFAARKYLTNLLKLAKEKYDIMNGTVYGIRNDFFGDSVTVSGLVTGGDLVKQLYGQSLGSRLLIPQNMLRHGQTVFLDDMTLDDVSAKLRIPIRVVKQDGADLLSAFLGR